LKLKQHGLSTEEILSILVRKVVNRQSSLNETIGIQPPEEAERLRAEINKTWDEIEQREALNKS
jgi:hypothetical protein